MLANFSPASLSFRAAINSTGPNGDDIDLANPIPFPLSFPQAVHSDPAPQATVVTVAVEPAGPFQIRDLLLFDVGLVSIFDPDVGRRVRVKALTFAGSQNGPGSIQLAAGQVLVVRVAYRAGAMATTETVQLQITTPQTDRATIPLSLTTFVPPPQSMVETAVSADHFSIVAGGRARLSVTVRSVSGPAADVRFQKSEILLDANVTMESVTVHVEPGQTAFGALLFHADSDARLGTFDLAIQQFALTPANHLPFIDLRVTIIAAPTVSATCLTQHNDNQRTGANLTETMLTTSNVNGQQFGKVFELTVDGHIYAQPLYLSDVLMAGERRSVLYVATMRNHVYAFDADDASVLWHVSLGPFVPLPDEHVGGLGYHDISDAVGVVSTPVISLQHNGIYVLALTKEGDTYTHRLHALDISDGRELFNGPRIVAASVRGSGTGSDQGVIRFVSSLQNQRPGLLLSNDCVYAAFASYGDQGLYHGWVCGFKADTLDPLPTAFNTTPDGAAGGIWQAGQGPAADVGGNLYVMTGNGTFSDGARPMLGDSIVKLGPDLSLQDWFSPFDTNALNQADNDLGSGGALLIPNSHLLVGGGKVGKLYLLDTSRLGHFNAAGDTQIVQSWQATGQLKNGVAPPPAPDSVHHHIHGSPIIWDEPNRGSTIYIWGEADWMRAFTFKGGRFDTDPADMTTMTTPGKSMPGAMLSLSADGSRPGTGIIWASHPTRDDANRNVVDGLVRAFDASNLQNELWNSEQNPVRDRLGNIAKFTPPTIANGKVYLATFSNKVVAYGLL